MACGCPVIATPNGSVPEVIEHGRTGFIVANEDAAVSAVAMLGALDRHAIRARFEERWCASRMAEDYLAIYSRLAGVPLLQNPLAAGADEDVTLG
jgi:glycosyltransferase involved in cell wall biosynthesis